MKKLLFLLTLIASLTALPPIAGAKDKDKDKDKDRDKQYDSDREKKEWKDIRNAVRELREQQDRSVQTVNNGGVSKRSRETVIAIGQDVDRVSAQFERGNFDYGNMRDRISRLNNDIVRVREQMAFEWQHRRR